jgi:Protein of unknown function (DUF2721)
MPGSTALAEQLSQIISQATAPAFLLGAMAGLISVLVGRMNRIIDRTNALTAVPNEDPARGRLRTDIPRLERRAKLVNKAIEFAVISGIFTTLLVLIAFASAFLGIAHGYGAAVLFMLALGSFGISLIYLWLEVRISLSQFDFYS